MTKKQKEGIKRLKKLFAEHNELTEQDYVTGLDYSLILLDSYSASIDKLDVLRNPIVKKAYDKATENMAKLYQVIGQELYKYEEKTHRRSKKHH